jgi:hypothetical protein
MRSLAEWAGALGVLWFAAWLSWPWIRSLGPPSSGTFALVESALPALPTGVAAGAEDVPFLMLDSGVIVRRGMAERELVSQPLSHLAADPPRSEPGVLGERTVLTFRSGPSRFWVVLDRTDIGRDREVTAIYVK